MRIPQDRGRNLGAACRHNQSASSNTSSLPPGREWPSFAIARHSKNMFVRRLAIKSRLSPRCAWRGGRIFLACEQAVERSREAGIDGHLHDDLRDLFTAQADVQAGLDVNLELRAGIAERRQRGNGRDLAGSQIEAGAGIDIAEGELDYIAREIGRDVRQRSDDVMPSLAVNLI